MSQHVSQFPIHAPHSNNSPSIPIAQHKDAKSISDEDIAKRAYGKYVARGSAHGFDREDWASAKRELVTEASHR
jgi:hypothetical protein